MLTCRRYIHQKPVMYRVFVGLEVEPDGLLDLKQDLDRQYKLSSLLVDFVP